MQEVALTVPSYGVFYSSGVPYLHQEDGTGRHPSLKTPSPFRLRLPRDVQRVGCPHKMNPTFNRVPGWVPDKENRLFWENVPDVKAPLSAPRRTLFILENPSNYYGILSKLSEMQCPTIIHSQIISWLGGDKTAISRKLRDIEVELRRTNLTPCILSGLTMLGSNAQDFVLGLDPLLATSKRPLLLVGDETVMFSEYSKIEIVDALPFIEECTRWVGDHYNSADMFRFFKLGNELFNQSY